MSETKTTTAPTTAPTQSVCLVEVEYEIQIQGCPSHGLAALDFRRMAGIGDDRADNRIPLALTGGERGIRALTRVGATPGTRTNGSLALIQPDQVLAHRACGGPWGQGWRAVLPAGAIRRVLAADGDARCEALAEEVEAAAALAAARDRVATEEAAGLSAERATAYLEALAAVEGAA